MNKNPGANNNKYPYFKNAIILLKKDFLTVKYKLLLLTAIISIFLPLLFISKESFIFLCLFPLTSLSAILHSDSQNQTDFAFFSLPIKKTVMVMEKYLMMLFLTVVCFVLTFIEAIPLKLLFPEFIMDLNSIQLTEIVFFYLLPIILFALIYFPIYFRFGYFKGSATLMFIIVFFSLALDIESVLPSILSFNKWLYQKFSQLAGYEKILALIISLSCLLYLSFSFSVYQVKKREI